MNAEQKERAIQLITTWRARSITTRPEESAVCGDCITDILQELVDAPEPEPVAYAVFQSKGHVRIWFGDLESAQEWKKHTYPTADLVPLYTSALTPAEPPADVARDIRLQVESEFSALLPGVTYMDEPDGGTPTVQEQVKRMARDAERYRWLRRGQHWSVINGIGDVLRADDIDYAIDAAIERQRGE